MELLRTVATIVELGSFTKAGDKLGVSQPAISAQIKRLQVIVGGPIFDKVAGGVTLNSRGLLIQPHIQRILDANDQILSIGGAAKDPRPLRLGLSDIYVPRFVSLYDKKLHGEVVVISENSDELRRGLADGYIDLACLLQPSPAGEGLLKSWEEEFVWVRGTSFVLSPGAPVPLVGWPTLVSDRSAVAALEANGLPYRLCFQSFDYQARLAAVLAGLGVMALPTAYLASPLMHAKEYYLPPLPPISAGVCARVGLILKDYRKVIDALFKIVSHPETNGVGAAKYALAASHLLSVNSPGH